MTHGGGQMCQSFPAVLRLYVQPTPLQVSPALCEMNLPSLSTCAAWSGSLPCSAGPAPRGEEEHHGYGLALAQLANRLLQECPWRSLGLRGGRVD